MSNPIPDTNDRNVAAMAAALHIVDSTRGRATSADEAFLTKLERFVDAFEVILASDRNIGTARDVLERVTSRRQSSE